METANPVFMEVCASLVRKLARKRLKFNTQGNGTPSDWAYRVVGALREKFPNSPSGGIIHRHMLNVAGVSPTSEGLSEKVEVSPADMHAVDKFLLKGFLLEEEQRKLLYTNAGRRKVCSLAHELEMDPNDLLGVMRVLLAELDVQFYGDLSAKERRGK